MPPAEPRARRVQRAVASPNRVIAGIPPLTETAIETGAIAASDAPPMGRRRSSRRSAAGRIFLLLIALLLLGGLGVSGWLFKDLPGPRQPFSHPGRQRHPGRRPHQVSRAQMLPVFGEDIGRNIFFVPISERRRQLEEIPWIENATVERILPDQLRVSVIERQPVAFVRSGSQIGLVDANGVLLAMPAAMMAQHHYSFPVVTGIDARAPLDGRKLRMGVYQRLLAELDAGGQQISQQISEIDLADPADAKVLMPEQGADILAHFGQDRFRERYQRYKAHIAEWRQQYPQLAAVDLRYDQQVVLQMTPGSSVAQAAANEQTEASAGDTKPADGQVAEPRVNELPEKHPSGAKAHVDSVGFTRGLKPPSPSVPGFSAASTDPASRTAFVSDPKPGAAARTSPAVKARPAKAGVKNATGPKTAALSVKSKTLKPATAKTAADRAKDKKRAQAKRAALNLSIRKAAPTNPQAPSAGIGQ